MCSTARHDCSRCERVRIVAWGCSISGPCATHRIVSARLQVSSWFPTPAAPTNGEPGMPPILYRHSRPTLPYALLTQGCGTTATSSGRGSRGTSTRPATRSTLRAPRPPSAPTRPSTPLALSLT